jgi:hypothetical protein
VGRVTVKVEPFPTTLSTVISARSNSASCLKHELLGLEQSKERGSSAHARAGFPGRQRRKRSFPARLKKWMWQKFFDQAIYQNLLRPLRKARVVSIKRKRFFPQITSTFTKSRSDPLFTSFTIYSSAESVRGKVNQKVAP